MWIKLPRLRSPLLESITLIFSVVLLVASAVAESALPEQLELEARIRRLVSTPRARNVKSCAVAYLGMRPCGGARDYVIYSNEVTNEGELQALISRYNELDSKSLEGMNSICEALVVGPLELIDGVCREKKQ